MLLELHRCVDLYLLPFRYRNNRGLDRALIRSLSQGNWLTLKQNILLTGATGSGKTFLACALGHNACRQGYKVYYYRLKGKRLVRTVLIFTESSDQLSRATDRVPGLPASPGYVQ